MGVEWTRARRCPAAEAARSWWDPEGSRLSLQSEQSAVAWPSLGSGAPDPEPWSICPAILRAGRPLLGALRPGLTWPGHPASHLKWRRGPCWAQGGWGARAVQLAGSPAPRALVAAALGRCWVGHSQGCLALTETAREGVRPHVCSGHGGRVGWEPRGPRTVAGWRLGRCRERGDSGAAPEYPGGSGVLSEAPRSSRAAVLGRGNGPLEHWCPTLASLPPCREKPAWKALLGRLAPLAPRGPRGSLVLMAFEGSRAPW